MLRVERRIEKLQRAFGISEERTPPWEHRIVFIDSEGQVSPETLLLSEGRQEWIKGDGSE
jgi:hypothetical protein